MGDINAREAGGVSLLGASRSDLGSPLPSPSILVGANPRSPSVSFFALNPSQSSPLKSSEPLRVSLRSDLGRQARRPRSTPCPTPRHLKQLQATHGDPRRFQDMPRPAPRGAPRGAQDRSRPSQDHPKIASRPPKTTLRAPQDTPRPPQNCLWE